MTNATILPDTPSNRSMIVDKPSIRSMETSDALVSDQGFTYNEAGKTYNEAGMVYAGVYLGDGRRPTNASIIFQ